MTIRYAGEVFQGYGKPKAEVRQEEYAEALARMNRTAP